MCGADAMSERNREGMLWTRGCGVSHIMMVTVAVNIAMFVSVHTCLELASV